MSEQLDIAIIGMSAMYAGAKNAPTLWRNIVNKVYSVTDAGPEWGQKYYEPQPSAPNRVYTRMGGWLHDMARFDPRDFGIMPGSVDGREPDHFLTLKHAHDALVDSGYGSKPFNRERAGIILGRGNNTNRSTLTILGHGYIIDQMLDMVAKVRPDFSDRDLHALRDGLFAQLPALTADILPGMVPNVNTGIIANRLDLMGPNFILDAACASVLIAIEQASRELNSGRCDLMLAGGVHAQNPPQVYMIFSIIKALARSQIRPFQKGGDGTLLGEGCGMLVLKRLADAERDGDRIYAVIKGTGVASDGKAKGLFAPRKEGQVVALKRAYESCGIDPQTIGLIEAHATGIPLGDRTEIQSLTDVFGPRRGTLPTVALGSVKSMIGHAVPASGGASVIKTALALQHKILPPTLCDEPVPELELEKTPFYINNETRPWIHHGKTPRRAGVDAFGFGGINAHGILEEYVPRGRTVKVSVLHAPSESELFVFGAADQRSLVALLQMARRRLQDTAPPSPAALAKALSEHARGNYRLSIVAADSEDLAKKLDQALEKLSVQAAPAFKTRSGVHFGHGAPAGKVCMLFPGEGAQYVNMLADVCVNFPQARAWFEALEDDREEKLSDLIFPPPTTLEASVRSRMEARLNDVDVSSESVFTASMALHAVLESLAIRTDAMVGHSTGESTALVASRVRRYTHISEIAKATRDLTRLLIELDELGQVPRGTLLTIGALRPPQREQLLSELGSDVMVAMDNCPNQLVLFGPPPIMQSLRERMSADGAICLELPFGRAYHTPLFKAMADGYRRYFDPEDFGLGATTLYSACSAAPFPEEPKAIVEQLSVQWEKPVRFIDTVRRLYADGYRVFIEVGPSSNLTSFVSDILRDADNVVAVATNSRRKSGIGQLHSALAQLHACGVDWQPQALFADRVIEEIILEQPARDVVMPVLPRLMPMLRWPENLPVPPMPLAPASSAAPARIAANDSLAPSVPLPLAAAASAAAAVTPQMQALRSHFALMQEFLDSQTRVMGLGGNPGGFNGYAAAAPMPASMVGIDPAASFLQKPVNASSTKADPAVRFPLLGELISMDADRLSVNCALSIKQHPFLADHTLGGVLSSRNSSLHALSVVPFTFSMEIAAEAAAMLLSDQKLVTVAIEQSRGSRWLTLDDSHLDLRVSAERAGVSGSTEVVKTRIFRKNPQGAEMPVFEARVHLAANYSAPAGASKNEAAPMQPAVVSPNGELYRHGMFHGPRLQGVSKVLGWSATAIDGECIALPSHDLLAHQPNPQFQFDPALLDAVGQLAGFWLLEKSGPTANCFPFSVERCSFFAPPPAPGMRMHCRTRLHSISEQTFAAEFDLLDGQQRVICKVENWQDRQFTRPQRFVDYFSDAPQQLLSDALELSDLPADAQVRCIRPYADDFLSQGAGIWKRVLAHMVLTQPEREQFYALPEQGPRQQEWLFGRIVAKDAIRAWAQKTHRVMLACVDIEIVSDSFGAPAARLAMPCAEIPERLPMLSIAHSHGTAVAAIGGHRIGTDVQQISGIDADAVAIGSLHPDDHRWLAGLSGDDKRLAVVSLWCAKEAAAKCDGAGLQGLPQAWRITAVQPESGRLRITVEHAGKIFSVRTEVISADQIFALCFS